MADKHNDLVTLSQASSITVASLAATDLVSTGFGADTEQDGRTIFARIIAGMESDVGGISDHARALVGVSSQPYSAALQEEAIEAVPDRRIDGIKTEQAGRFVRVLGPMMTPYGDPLGQYHSMFDSGWIKLNLEFFADMSTLFSIFVYNYDDSGFDAQTTFRMFTQARVRFA